MISPAVFGLRALKRIILIGEMKNIGITNIIFGGLSIVVGIVSIWGGNRLLKGKNKLLF